MLCIYVCCTHIPNLKGVSNSRSVSISTLKMPSKCPCNTHIMQQTYFIQFVKRYLMLTQNYLGINPSKGCLSTLVQYENEHNYSLV